jgi:hypothetical protein
MPGASYLITSILLEPWPANHPHRHFPIHFGKKYQIFAIYTNESADLYFQHYQGKPPFDSEEKRRELLDRLNTIPGVKIPIGSISRRPSIPLSILAKGDNLNRFLAVFDWFIAEVQKT